MILRPRRVGALLGPTNTGKTYRAIQRMLQHPSGMFGLPLRLLAREVYDRVVQATGPDQVALVTGEEKRVPPGARYFICTVEAMPIDRKVAFVAIDEVQLAGDRRRGHVFTDRILHCRGLEETLFLGSETIEVLLKALVPGIEVERAERFSTLTSIGAHRMGRIPKRSAVVTFSAEGVYEIAEALKRRHGGTAVVLGALSPRARNAQVELYQTGRVDHLVATDAIGMGLNLDLQHVALEAVRKYDGRGTRDLTAAEVGQIAGRAGRYKTPGTFGSLHPLELSTELVEAVEQHRFPSVRQVFWRNTSLDYASAEALLASLEREPDHPAFIPVKHEDDQHVLAVFARDRELMDRVGDPEAVARLWEVCQVPDFRKTRTDSHVRMLRELANIRLGARQQLQGSWVDDRLSRLDRVDGDIDTLMARIAWIRTWTYITHRDGWMEDAAGYQARTAAMEERVSDALHEALTARFVELRVFSFGANTKVVVREDAVWIDERQVAVLRGLELDVVEGVTRGVLNQIRGELRAAMAARVEAFESAEDDAFEVDEHHRILWRGGWIATLSKGPSLSEPRVSMPRMDALEGNEKDRIRVRVERWVRATIATLLTPLRRDGEARGALGGLVFELERGLGTVHRSQVADLLRQLGPDDDKALARRGIRRGVHAVYVPSTLKPAMVRIRARLMSIELGAEPTLEAPDDSRTAVEATGDPCFWLAIGFPVVGGLAVRADVLERCAAELRDLARHRRPFAIPETVASRLAVGPALVARFVEGLGYRRHRDGYVASRSGGGRGGPRPRKES